MATKILWLRLLFVGPHYASCHPSGAWNCEVAVYY